MSSSRFPGKVLAPLSGRPLVKHVVDACAEALGAENVVVATSVDTADDPLAVYLESIDVAVFRGPLEDVVARFRLCAAAHPCEWIARISADSPRLDPAVVRLVADSRGDYDLVTTVEPRTVPHGQAVELLRTAGAARAARR